jgi:neutral ceramidase
MASIVAALNILARRYRMTLGLPRRRFISGLAASAFSSCLLTNASTLLNAGTASSSTSADRWKAGIAKRVITPETSVWLAGYGSKRAPDGKLHDLWMKAIALEDQSGNRVVLITSDFQGVPKIMSDRVFKKAEEQFHLTRSQIMFTFSHNHCGPRLGDDLIDYYLVDEAQEKLVAEYTDLMVDRTCRT